MTSITSITGRLDALLFVKPDQSWGTALFYVEEDTQHFDRGAVTVVGELIPTLPEEVTLTLHGAVGEHPRYGKQFNVIGYSSEGITSADGAHRWLKRLDGIGEVLAERIYAHFGEEIITILNTEPDLYDPLLKVVGIGAETAREIRDSWQDLKTQGDIEDIRFFDAHGLTAKETKELLSHFKNRRPEGVSSVRELVMASLWEVCYPKLGWARVDRIARKLRIQPFVAGRVHAAVLEAAARISRDEGSTCLPVQAVAYKAAGVGGFSVDTAFLALTNMERESQVKFVTIGGTPHVMSGAHYEIEITLLGLITGTS